MKTFVSLFSLILIIGYSSCKESNHRKDSKVKSVFDSKGVVQEAINTSGYTYCLVATGGNKFWIAMDRMPVVKNQTLYFNQGLEMKDFHSKELNRTFPIVYFVQEVSTTPNPIPLQVSKPKAQKPTLVKTNMTVNKAKGGIRIAELYAHKKRYAGKIVRIRGKVTKFNPEIMGKNWVHMQDGTDNHGNFDLTVTTQAVVKQGDIVTFEGTITLDKDLGSGYFYPVLMEKAKKIQGSVSQ